MCEDCGCGVTQTSVKDTRTVEVLGRLLDANNRAAGHNREHFDSHRVVAFNLMSSPGAGKTSLLEVTIEALKSDFRIAVIEGDLETDNDARRIRAHGVPAVQINTGSACHLDARMIHEALHKLPLSQIDIVFIENVGNLVCPASFDLVAGLPELRLHDRVPGKRYDFYHMLHGMAQHELYHAGQIAILKKGAFSR